MMVSFGNASGAVEPINPALLTSKGSLFLTRPTLAHYTQTPQELRQSAQAFFATLSKGLKITCNTQFSLRDATSAHQQLEGRAIIGQAVLVP
jgi:NADPH2:quinone reductase